MKKIFTIGFMISLVATIHAQTQIGNSGFENWENIPGGSEPVNWNSFLTANGGVSTLAQDQIAVSSDSRPGSPGTKSVRIFSKSIFGIIANGNVTLGRIHMGAASATSTDNYNRTIRSNADYNQEMTDRPDSIVFWVKFKPNGGGNDLARMSATIHDNYDYRDPEDAASSNHIVGRAELNFLSTNNAWVRKAVAFDYSGPASDAQYILLTFTTNKTPGGGSGNDQVWIDDVELVYTPKASFTSDLSSACEGDDINFTNTSTNFATDYQWEFPGGTPAISTDENPTVTYNTPGTYDVTLIVTNQWGSDTVTYSDSIVINSSDASFNYSQPDFCKNVTNPVPTTAVNSGTFTSSPSGLVFVDATTGEIDLNESTAGTYDITYTLPGSCAAPINHTVIIHPLPDASFNYPSNSICSLGGNQIPSIIETGGTFLVNSSGLIIDATTGEIDVASSTDGDYEITYTITGACSSSSSVNVTLTDSPNAEFNYDAATFCLNDNDPSPNFVSGSNAGEFSSASGLSIDANSGAIDLSSSDPNVYTVENMIAAIDGCPMASYTVNIEINDIPTVNLVLPVDTLCIDASGLTLTGGDPQGGVYSGTGVSGSILDVSSFSNGEEATITYTVTDDITGCSNADTGTIFIDACLNIEEFNSSEAVSIYPNPTEGILNVDKVQQKTQYVISNALGQVVKNGELLENANSINIKALKKGTYFIRFQQGVNISIHRVIKL